MANPSWLDALNAQHGQAYTDPATGLQYIPVETNGPNGPETSYRSIAANTPGLGGFGYNDFNVYDGQGNDTGKKESMGYTDDWFTKYMPYAIAALATMGVGSTIAGAGAGAGVGAGAGAGGSELATGGFLGEAPWVATPGATALDFGAAAGAGTGALSAASTGAGGGGLSSLLGPGASSLLGPAATVIGGLLGSKGTKTSTDTTKDIPDWLKPYVGKMLDYSGGLLDKQMAPGYLQGYDDMRNVGQGLLNQPIAGNGVGKVPYPTNFGFRG